MRQERRGLSSVVGAIFMMLVMVAGLNVALWTMQQQDRVTEAVVEKANSNLDKLNEEIEISDIRVSGAKLNMTIVNTGGAAANLKSIYVVNETAKMQYRYDVDLTVDGRNSVNVDTLPLTVMNNTSYSVKVVSMAGNTATSRITPLSTAALPMSLYIIPPTVTPNENVTVLFTVTNNITDSNLGWAVVPKLQYSCSGCTLTQYSAPSTSPTMIGKGNTALFKWVYKATGPDRTSVNFNASLTNAKQGNYVTEKALIKLVESAQTSFSSEIIISSSLVQKPEIFVLVPSPFGDSGERGLWGVIVANPTNVTMDVSRIVINMYTSKPASNHQMIKETECNKNGISPTSTSEWSCPHDNMIEWKNVGSPQQIKPFDAKSFMVKIEPGSLGGGSVEPAFMISTAVFTNMGQFTKTGFSSGMTDAALSLGSVYLTDTNNAATAVTDTHIFGNISGIASGEIISLNVTVADLDTEDLTEIKAGADLIINVPRGFTEVTPISNAAFSSITKRAFSDGSTQIIATLAGDLGDASDTVAEGQVLSFTALAPITNSTRVYIMHTLLDGETSNNFSVGAIAELALQVLREE
jgi:hypothetical protein